jgi:hypothetical protein
MSLDRLEYGTETFCPYPKTWWTKFLIIVLYGHYVASAMIFFEGLVRTKELYLVMLSFGITTCYWLGYILQWLFMAAVPVPACGASAFWCVDPASPYNACGRPPFPSPAPHGATCGAAPLPPCDPCVPCGMPAVEPMLVAFAVTSVITFALQWRAPKITFYALALLISALSLVVWGHSFFMYNSPIQGVVGVFFGVLYGLFYQVANYVVAVPNYNRMIAWPMIRSFGYKNEFCQE